MNATLYGLGQSPWTERARWALDHHGIPYEYREHVPMLGEVFLRMKTRTTKPSVPLLLDGSDVVMGSSVIGRHADRRGQGQSLFPAEHEVELERWVELAEGMANVGRAWLMTRIVESPEAQMEALPPFVPSFLRKAMAPTAAMGTRFLASKWNVASDVDVQVTSTLRPALEAIRAAVAKGPYLLQTGFSFADVAVAAALHVVRPREDATCGPATREAWTNEALVDDFADLLEWRDAIYAKHR